jgi:hypothetical protein
MPNAHMTPIIARWRVVSLSASPHSGVLAL